MGNLPFHMPSACFHQKKKKNKSPTNSRAQGPGLCIATAMLVLSSLGAATPCWLTGQQLTVMPLLQQPSRCKRSAHGGGASSSMGPIQKDLKTCAKLNTQNINCYAMSRNTDHSCPVERSGNATKHDCRHLKNKQPARPQKQLSISQPGQLPILSGGVAGSEDSPARLFVHE